MNHLHSISDNASQSVLIIENSPELQDITAQLTNNEQIEVATVDNVSAAPQILSEHEIDLVVLNESITEQDLETFIAFSPIHFPDTVVIVLAEESKQCDPFTSTQAFHHSYRFHKGTESAACRIITELEKIAEEKAVIAETMENEANFVSVCWYSEPLADSLSLRKQIGLPYWMDSSTNM